ncbi:MAG: flagellar basal body-associated FliL family protein [Verrucomicrobiia bacterium]|jgi:flagellar FliL protein
MATNRIEQKGEGDKVVAPSNGNSEGKGGFLQTWLPVIVTVVAMPIFAYVTTMYVMLPKLEKSLGIKSGSESAAESEKGEGAVSEKGGKSKQAFQLNKVIVNVSGSAGTRYLLGSFTLVGTAADFKSRMEEHKDQLLDIASSIMSTKTISDLEKPGARNLIRNELISAFNNALGGTYVKEIYITEFAIQ